VNNQQQYLVHRRREFGEIIGDSFKILFRNFKSIGTAFLIFVMPVFLIMAILVSIFGKGALQEIISMQGSPDNFNPLQLISGLSIFYIGIIICYIFLSVIIFCALKAYRLKADDSGISFNDIKPLFWKYVGPVSLSYLIVYLGPLIALAAIIGALAMINAALAGIVAFILTFVWIYIVIAWSLFGMAIIEGDMTAIDSIKRSYELVKDNWWAVFGVLLIASLIASILSSVLSMPYYIVSVISAITDIETGEGIEKFGTAMGIYLLLSMLGSLLGSMYTQTAMGLKYYDLVEKKDSTSLTQKVQTLGQHEEKFFENEGDF